MKHLLLATVTLAVLAQDNILLAAAPPLTDQQKIVHALNRLGYGPRPGDVERVKKMGLKSYLQQQLLPETIDDSAVETKLAGLTTITMSAAELSEAFREEQEEQRRRQKERAEAEKEKEANAQAGAAQDKPAEPRRPAMDMKEVSDRISVRTVAELQNEKIIRAVASERQFQEVLVDFWSNHFNIDIRKNACRVLKTVDERDVIRAHVFGKFRDLLTASAKSPAMLVYLDNAQNAAPRDPNRRQRGNADPEARPPMRGGLNENYAREIMELHTLGVDGGYTQQDVIEVALCFTGWTLNPREGSFLFTPGRHDNGKKTVLGHSIAGGGIKDGEEVIDILCRHPSTAKFIATKLCRRLVSDDPPPSLVERVAKTFLDTDGDLRKVYEAIIFSPEFFSPAAYRAKIKSPFEYAVSAVRLTGTPIEPKAGLLDPKLRRAAETGATFERGGDRANRMPRKSLNMRIIEMGQTLFAYQAPTGWPEDSRKWVSTGALIARLNFALAFTSHGVVDADFVAGRLLDGVDIDEPDAVMKRLTVALLQGELSESTRKALTEQLDGDDNAAPTGAVNPAKLTALILGSPEFQRH
jgi:uncharacterized protein (DUF1800 family)